MKHYELFTLMPGTMTETDIPPFAAQVQELLQKHGASNVSCFNRGKSRLAYPVQHIRYGYFNTYQFEAEHETIPKMQKELALTRELLRAIITAYDPESRKKTQKQLGISADEALYTLSNVKDQPTHRRMPPESERREKISESDASIALETPKEFRQVKKEIEKTKKEAPVVTHAAEPIDIADIDKKLDELLEEDLKRI